MLKMRWAAIALIMVACSAFGQAKGPVPGKDYLELSPPQPTEAAGKVEVIEFFWYRCPHCYSLEPYLENWLKTLPADTQFRRVPAVFDDEWAIDARIFYALEAIGQEQRVHRALFDAIHKQGGAKLKGQTYVKWIAEWLAKQGVDMAKYEAALRSSGVESSLKRAIQSTKAFRLDGVPMIAINGRYIVVSDSDRQEVIDIADALLTNVRNRKLP